MCSAHWPQTHTPWFAMTAVAEKRAKCSDPRCPVACRRGAATTTTTTKKKDNDDEDKDPALLTSGLGGSQNT